MKGFPSYIIIALLLCISSFLEAQPSADYKKVDEFIKNYPLRPSTPGDIRVLAREIKRQSFTDDEKARAAFYWIAHNIEYDCAGYRQNQGLHLLEDVLSQHKGICAGYAGLMKFFCEELGVECITIEGFATGIGVEFVHEDSLRSNHAWNAVNINGQWKLVDPTWGSGSANDDCTKIFPAFKEKYFYARPEELIVSHFPESSYWQLLDTPLTARQFAEKIKQKMTDVETIYPEPRDSVIHRKLGETVRFRFEKKDQRNMIYLSIYGKNQEKPVDIYDSLQITEGSYYYDFKIKKTGYYRVDVSIFYYSGTESESTGTNIETYYLHVPVAAPKPKTTVKRN